MLWEVTDDETDISGVWLRWIDSSVVLEYTCECCGCTKNYVVPDMRAAYSMLEKMVFYYIRQAFPDAVQHYHADWLGNREMDMFIPSLRIGIEVDSAKRHKNLYFDKSKDDRCEQQGVRIIRIREKGCPELNDLSICIGFSGRGKSLEKAINKCLELLGESSDINFERDKKKFEKLLAAEVLEDVKKKHTELYKQIYVCGDCLRELDLNNNSKAFQIGIDIRE